MTLTIDRKAGKYRASDKISPNDPENLMIIGEWFEDGARRSFENGSYDEASNDYRRAAKFYDRALDHLETDDPSRFRLRRLSRENKMASEKSALYRDTAGYSLPVRWLMRKIKAKHILSSFIIALFFSAPNLTGNAIGNNDFIFSVVGAVFFFIGVFLSYFFVWKNVLRIRIADK